MSTPCPLSKQPQNPPRPDTIIGGQKVTRKRCSPSSVHKYQSVPPSSASHDLLAPLHGDTVIRVGQSQGSHTRATPSTLSFSLACRRGNVWASKQRHRWHRFCPACSSGDLSILCRPCCIRSAHMHPTIVCVNGFICVQSTTMAV